jgi:tetratricopeptide (TPR) repeat protein
MPVSGPEEAMSRRTSIVVVVATLLLGFGAGTLTAQKKMPITPSAWEGKSPEEAAAAILEVSATLVGTGSWENIHMGRVYYLSGEKAKAEEIFNRYSGAGAKAGDLIRIARVYAQAGEWDKAAPLYDRVVELKPTDSDWTAEAGAWFNLNGDRERAEELFTLSFAKSDKGFKNSLAAAGSYIGVEPRKR